MEKCEYYKDRKFKEPICMNHKYYFECNCGGDKNKCDYFLAIREEAREREKENKYMNTAEMWLKAQEDGYCYETNKKPILYYQKNKGLFDQDNCFCSTEVWDYFDDLMNEQWCLRAMTKSEAEAKFNIKIVGD